MSLDTQTKILTDVCDCALCKYSGSHMMLKDAERMKYQISLNDVSPEDLNSIKELIEKHAHYFEKTVMGNFGDDVRYSYHPDNFEISEIDADSFTYDAQISYYEGCKDKNYTDTHSDTIEYEIIDGEIIFDVDELVWDVR
ncbi:hypothetical protein [Hafnia alvei]|jgi:hypothetical protein|uniref:hypothetical protein n=1 Tax=Hafnia alvei TaxID=569 RepID=UPI001034C471|nr:hypothetical protein [Hafnia alvei]TBL62058.1 hypothetical protein EYY92_05345 [Hafnia alvei]